MGKLDGAIPAPFFKPKGWNTVLFILFLSAGQAQALRPVHKDTITVDGVPLALELEVSQEPISSPDARKKVRNLSRRSPALVWGMAPGVGWSSNSALGQHVSRFIEKGARPSATVLAALEWSAERMFFRCEGAFSAWNAWSYDASFLNDSLYKLESDGEGGLQQLIRFTYPDLGIELDTLSLPVSLHAVQSLSLGIGAGGVMGKKQGGRKAPRRWWCSITGSRLQSRRGINQVNRVLDSTLPSPAGTLDENRNDWEPAKMWSMGLRVGASFPWGRQGWEGLVIGQWSGGPAPLSRISFGIQKRWVNKR
ncbi:hypothetical protein OAH93_02175 [Flavobacteriales bacterium]|nr:hypothetical protein [Flavobacteriales bacterium]